MRLWRPRWARTSHLVTLALVAAVTVTATACTAAVVFAARGIVYTSGEGAIVSEFDRWTDVTFITLADEPRPSTWRAEAEAFPGPALIIDTSTGRRYGTLSDDDLPRGLAVEWEGSASEKRAERGVIDGEEVIVVGRAEGDIVIIAAWSLQREHDEVISLIGVGAVITLSALSFALFLGALIGRRLAHPLQRLAAMAADVGAGHPPAPFASRLTDLDHIGQALTESSRRLQQTVTELQRREGHSRRLVGDVAHELRTPLTSMVAVSEILADPDSTDDERDLATGIIRSGTARLAFLVDDLLERSRIDAGIAPVTVSTVRLDELLDGARALVSGAEAIEVRCPDDLLIDTDAQRLTKVVTNLLSNALRHGHAPLRLDARLDPLGAPDEVPTVTISMIDGGPGIDDDDRERIFHPFVVLDGSRGDPESTGLGLAIARETARLLGGDLRAERRGDGTAFVLTLLRCPATEPDPDER